MSDAPQTPPAPPKKSKRGLIITVIALLLALAAGGGGGYFYFSRAASKNTAEKSKRQRASDEEAADESGAEKRAGNAKVVEMNLPDDSDVKQVIELQPFIVNLADKGEARYLRMTVSIGLGEGLEKDKPDPLFVTRVRNAMLAVLTTKTSDEILTPEGKAELRKELLRAARAAVPEPEVRAIYITDFIVQL
ncbi:flagellar basal body-associated FliL family protein [Pyrinomonas methylaliphatogenes]|jgi:flagellar FliL protein|uniref:Flagellar protein FliL n=1 Tax=Pyrinomonas methylaliphatogenes TaxID=454194 RepID=A0A0B6WY41_9BACT|nr:flagellar basal body-associated FliL family protein [Pyrinomonas methylaliphatogenes]MBX5478957.1 flagellar basal body-associated FliL family protein [Pyrinomonas methylaliphatogenes]CDM65632.1 flagellar basal body-associated protein [Pyrinomonas methylaliphatogenes]